MLDALLFAVRDGIRAYGMNYGYAECGISDDGKPPPRAGNWYVTIHGGKTRPGQANDNSLFELYDFNVTLTARVTIPLDQVGDNLLARNIPLTINSVPAAQRQGFNAKLEQLRAYLHMNWQIIVLPNQTPPSANDNIAAWVERGTVRGFCEPARYAGGEIPRLVGGEWFGAAPDVENFGLKSEMRFINAKRFQPQTSAIGEFV